MYHDPSLANAAIADGDGDILLTLDAELAAASARSTFPPLFLLPVAEAGRDWLVTPRPARAFIIFSRSAFLKKGLGRFSSSLRS